MADIFISYSKDSSEPTVGLAGYLEYHGYSTWWDTDLLPGERYHERIATELDKAKAVIVIWTSNSVSSRWVKAEAEWAAEQNKLITVRTPDLNPDRIPFPFNTLHTELVTEREKIRDALLRAHVFPRRRANVNQTRPKWGPLFRRHLVRRALLAGACFVFVAVGIQIFNHADFINYEVVSLIVSDEKGYPLNGKHLFPKLGFATYLVVAYGIFALLFMLSALLFVKARDANLEELRGLRQDFDDAVRFASNITGYLFPSGDRDVPRFDITDINIKYIIDKNGDTEVHGVFELDCVKDPAHFWIYWIEADAESRDVKFIRQLNFQVVDMLTGQRLDWLVTHNTGRTKVLAIFFPEISPGTQKTLSISYFWPRYMGKLIDLNATNFEWRYITQNPERLARFKAEWEFDKAFSPLECRIIGNRSPTAAVRLETDNGKFSWIYEDPETVLKSKYAVEFFDREGREVI